MGRENENAHTDIDGIKSAGNSGNSHVKSFVNGAVKGKTEVTDSFFAPFLDKIIDVTTPDILTKFIAEGAMENYERVINGERGGHNGEPWYHALICEVITGVSDLLTLKYDSKLDNKLDEIIDAIARAQSPDGWLHPYDTLERPGMEFGLNGGDALYQHETYSAGCMIEAGVHHYLSTGKKKLLSCAVKMANYLADRIGPPPKWNIACEHSIAELAMLSLDKLFDDEPELADELGAKRGEYNRLALFWMDNKGQNEDRHQHPKYLREYAQDHRPAREQHEAVGHAVRAVLFYTAMAQTAIRADDESLASAVKDIWRDIVSTKLHINGSVGADRHDERFGRSYVLPNNAYLETCAGVGLLMLSVSMYRLTGDASCWDVAENTVFNLLPAAVSEDGVHYTYENPLESNKDFERWSWHRCPCCPPMLLKACGLFPNLIFTDEPEKLSVNLYIDAKTRFPDAVIKMSDAPGGKSLQVSLKAPKKLAVRIPAWAHDFNADLSYGIEKGYAVFELPAGKTEINITYRTMPVKIQAHPYVAADRGLVAVRRGPVLYCAQDRKQYVTQITLSDGEMTVNSDGTITAPTVDGRFIKLTEYRKWNNDGPSYMRVWLRQNGCTADTYDVSDFEGNLYKKWK